MEWKHADRHIYSVCVYVCRQVRTSSIGSIRSSFLPFRFGWKLKPLPPSRLHVCVCVCVCVCAAPSIHRHKRKHEMATRESETRRRHTYTHTHIHTYTHTHIYVRKTVRQEKVDGCVRSAGELSGVVVVVEETSIFGPSSSSSDLLRAFRLSGHTETDRQTDRQTETDRQTDRQTETGRQTGRRRQTDRQRQPFGSQPLPPSQMIHMEGETHTSYVCSQPSNPCDPSINPCFV